MLCVLREHVNGLRVNSTEGPNVKQSLKIRMRGRSTSATGRTRGCGFSEIETRIYLQALTMLHRDLYIVCVVRRW
jgi:hypothetical protein